MTKVTNHAKIYWWLPTLSRMPDPERPRPERPRPERPRPDRPRPTLNGHFRAIENLMQPIRDALRCQTKP